MSFARIALILGMVVGLVSQALAGVQEDLAGKAALAARDTGERALPAGCISTPFPTQPTGETGEQLIDYGGSSGAFMVTVWRQPCLSNVLKSAVMLRLVVTRGTPFVCNSSMTVEQDGRSYYLSGFRSETGGSMCGSMALNSTRFFVLDQSSYWAFDEQRGFLIRDRTYGVVVPGYAPVLRDLDVTLATSGTGGGRVTGSHGQLDCRNGSTGGCTAKIKEATSLILTATADAGSRFTGWAEPACGATAAITTIFLTKTLTCTARFDSAKAGLTLGFSGTGSGRVTSTDGRVDCNSSSGASCPVTLIAPASLTLNATASADSVFAGWVEAACGTAATTTIQIAVGAAVSCTAKFNQVPVDPQNGFWYDPARSGIGFGFERVGAKALLSAYMYRDDGSPFWFNVSGAYSIRTFSGKLEQFFGGPPLGANTGPGLVVFPGGTVTVTFSSPTAAQIRWDGLAAPIDLVRYQFGDQRTDITAAAGDAAAESQMTPSNMAAKDLATTLGKSRIIVTLKGNGDGRTRAGALQGRMAGLGLARVQMLASVPQFVADAAPAAVDALHGDPDVATVEFDRPMFFSLRQSGPIVQADLMRNAGVSGNGRSMVVIDSGVDAAHPFFGGRVIGELCFSSSIVGTTGRAISSCPNGEVAQAGPGAARPCPAIGCEHGTHVAGIAAGAAADINGVAAGAGIVAIQVVSLLEGQGCPPGSCSTMFVADILRAMDWVNQNGANFGVAAVNLSLGTGNSLYYYCDFSIFKPVIDALRAKGIATVAAAGNDFSSYRISEPACISSAIAVGATTKSDGIADFSNRWDLPLLMAPGEGIVSSVPGGAYAAKKGTSMAAPHVAGAVALLRSLFPNASVADLHNKLFATGTKVGYSFDPYRRMNIRDAALAIDQPNRILPDSGWWWTPGADGRGYFVETQGGQVFIASYHYRGDGPADWAVGQGQLGWGGQIHFDLRRFTGGTSLDGTPRGPSETAGIGHAILQFTSKQAGTILLPNGQRQSIVRFTF